MKMAIIIIISTLVGNFLFDFFFRKEGTERKEETEQKPIVVHEPELINEKLFEKTKELYKANIKQSINIIKDLLGTGDYDEYCKIQSIARKYLEEWEGKV